MSLSHKYTVVFLVAMLFSSLLSGCAGSGNDEEPGLPVMEEGEPTEVTITLSSRSMMSSGTRADGEPADPDDENEKIKDWFLVFVNRHGIVSKILTRSEALKGTAVEQESFKCIIPIGTYSIYAFANITPSELKAASQVEFSEGEVLTEENQSSIKKAVWKDTNLNLWDIKNKAIPMTGYLANVRITNRIEEPFSIEVVRMLAKIDFLISNTTSKDIKVNSIGLDPVTVTPVSLFPNGASDNGISYDFLGNYAFTPELGAKYERLMYKPATAWNVKAKTLQENAVRSRFYFKESLSKRDNGGLFTVWLDVTHADGDRSVLQYNVTSDIKKYINRNDWLVIPVELSRYAVHVEALFYPPIGGYPAYMSTTDPDGSQVFTFGTQGEFSIVPYVIDKETGQYLSPSLYNFEIDTASINDPEEIFKKKPYISKTSPSLPDEILGTLDSKEGKASLTIKVMVKDSPTDAEWSQTYLRTIHIIRDNNVVPDNTIN